MLYMLSSVCIDDNFFMKSYKTPQGLNIHSSFNSSSHCLSSLNNCESAIHDGGGGKEEDDKSFFSETQEKSPLFYDSKFVNNFENCFCIENVNKITPTSYNYTYTSNTLSKTLNKNQGNGNGNLSISSIYSSPYDYFSRNSENLEDTSHYGSCTDNNVGIITEFCSNTDTNLRSNDINPDNKYCYNPKVCSQILESLLQSKDLRNHTFFKKDQSDNNNNILLCKDDNVLGNSVKCPYRTVSHFGFNSPMRFPQPNHKHVAENLKNGQKYFPLSRSISYEEIFSSPRYLNLCEYCFELIVRLKPELKKCDIKLHNLTEYTPNDGCFKLVTNGDNEQSETPKCITNINKFHSEFGYPLDPVEEIDEKTTYTFYQNDPSNSILHDKITRINYYDLCSNTNYIHSIDLVRNPICFSEFINSATPGDAKNVDETSNNIECFENTVKIKDLEALSNKFSNSDVHSRRKLKFQEFDVCSGQRNNNLEYTERNNCVKTNLGDHLSFMKDINFEESSTFEQENPKVNNSSSDGIQELPAKCVKTNVKFYKNNEDENLDKYSPLERTILTKIHTNKLNKSDDIFEKIENTIRNKRTPSKLELLIKEQILVMRDKNKEEQIKNPLNKSFIYPKLKTIQNSNSLTRPNISFSTPKRSMFNKVSSVSSESISNTASASKTNKNVNITVRSCSKNVIKKASKSRNFILENIRNVSNPRLTPHIKRLQGNIDQKSEKGCIRLLSYEKNISQNVIRTADKCSPQNNASSGVYPFQSKLVKGSPRFWISMSGKGSSEKSRTSLMKSRHLLDSTFDTMPINANVVSTVDDEINALGAEIQQIHPRLENYKRKLDEFGNRVAECVNNMNECVTTQENITDIQEKLRNCIKSHQYSEGITCRVQTFSLSETED